MRGRLRSKGRIREGERLGTAKRALSADEIGQLINWLPNFPRLVDDVVTLYMWTCTRGSEILEMEVSEIKREKDGLWWTIPKAKTKNSWRDGATDLRVPLVGRTAAIVQRRIQAVENGYLFHPRVSAVTSSRKPSVRWCGCISRMQRPGLHTRVRACQFRTGLYMICAVLVVLSCQHSGVMRMLQKLSLGICRRVSKEYTIFTAMTGSGGSGLHD